jgi:diaminohydroxyphosphoribosylaminopyrimidine deaminase/5-amino-6-(5-phosphoribosylamino)uracil reductase
VRDDQAMEQALDAGAAARRRTAPNPWVGCVIVRDGEVVGRGATEPPGGAHAEIVALRAAGERARGATAYVTLEPCSHHGRTPPCADALIDAGVSRVAVALEDPDPLVDCGGIHRLQNAGVDVTRFVGRDRAEHDLAPYLHHRRSGRAYVVAKAAMSIDGRIAAADGTSQWITSAPARADAHELRADSQAVVVGAGTAMTDRPRLTPRDVAPPLPLRPPLRVVLDARGRVPAIGPLFDIAVAPTLVVTTKRAPASAVDAWLTSGARVETVQASNEGGVDLDATFALLGRDGVLQVLVEGGGALLGRVQECHAQRLVVYVAPLVLGTTGIPVFGRPGAPTMLEAKAGWWKLVSTRQVGADARLEFEIEEGHR